MTELQNELNKLKTIVCEIKKQPIKSILIEVKNVYGTDTYYPVSDDAINFARIAGTKTLTQSTIDIVNDMGYTIIIKQHVLIKSSQKRN